MNTIQKARILGESGKYDVCGGEICKPPEFTGGLENLPGIIKAKTQNGHLCSLLKTLQTNKCKHDCKYCANRAGCQSKLTEFEPAELAGLFNVLVSKGIVTGLFLSSGVGGDPDVMTEKMLRTIRLVRHKYRFQGYIHFKVLPGTSFELIKQASELSSRLSINIEAPNKSRLSELSSVKELQSDIIKRQAWIKRVEPRGGQTTQIIIGASNETDLEVLKMAKWEYNRMNLRRVYYSSFSPVKHTPLENKEKVPQTRANHLYNCDWLLREYKYKLSEIKEVLIDDMLPNKDPKIAIAENILTEPVNIEDADYNELIRVPGIGLKTAQKIIALRENNKVKSDTLKKCGVVMKRAGPFIRVGGEQQTRLNLSSFHNR
ncbi:helix-hairpin-helix domain-containing protein [Candidatus Woesearchaeota archaeon]|nr:helix-hairpin-helix domain-containing protein [Candidatus Woesearchaeota archaeon]